MVVINYLNKYDNLNNTTLYDPKVEVNVMINGRVSALFWLEVDIARLDVCWGPGHKPDVESPVEDARR